jgi:hypothetical protein
MRPQAASVQPERLPHIQVFPRDAGEILTDALRRLAEVSTELWRD